MDLRGCTALVTGASAGLGGEFARQLAPDARAIVLVARRKERLEEMRATLRARHPRLVVHVCAADLSQPNEVDALCEGLEKERLAIDLLINNAGLGDHGPFATSSPQRLSDIMQVNIVALTALTRRFLPAMMVQQRGGILNVSSIASFLPVPEMAVYAASKAYVTSFSEALRAEVRASRVSVTALCPGPVSTEFGDIATRPDFPRREAPSFLYVSPQEVVRRGLRGLARNQPLVLPGLAVQFAMGFIRLTPMPLLRLASRQSVARKRKRAKNIEGLKQ